MDDYGAGTHNSTVSDVNAGEDHRPDAYVSIRANLDAAAESNPR